jgi:hypothetical protein
VRTCSTEGHLLVFWNISSRSFTSLVTLMLSNDSRVRSWNLLHSHPGWTCFLTGVTRYASQLAATHTPVKSHLPFRVTDSSSQGSYDEEFGSHGFLHPVSIVFRESADEGWEAGFIVFVVKLGFMLSLDPSVHRKIKEVTARVSLDAYTTDDLPASSARLVFQEEIMFEQGEVRMNNKENLTQMDEDDDLENLVRVKVY